MILIFHFSISELQQIASTPHFEVLNLGCISILAIQNAMQTTLKNMTINWCMNWCFARHKNVGGVTNGDQCMCITDASLLDPKFFHFSTCLIPCAGDSRTTCGGDQFIQIYKILTVVQGNNVFKNQEQKRFIGYFKDADQLIGPNKIPHKAVPNATFCFLYCGMQLQPIAIFHLVFKTCICSRFTEDFNLDHRLTAKERNCFFVYSTLAEDRRCSNVALLPAPTSTRVGLISFPGSGNTWFRYLIERTTGVYTGSVYDETETVNLGYLGERWSVESRTLIQKEHLIGIVPERMARFSATILVIRNPFEAIISDFNRYVLHNKLISVSPEYYRSKGFYDYILKRHKVWGREVKEVVTSKKPYLIIFYDDLKKDPISQMRKVADFLAENNFFSVANLENRLLCLSQSLSGVAKRKPSRLGFDPFTLDMKMKVNNVIKNAQILLSNDLAKRLDAYIREERST